MALIRINRDPSRCQLAGFGLMWLVFFGVIGWIVLSKGGSMPAAAAVWAVAVVVPVVGWIAPPAMRLVYLGMSYAAYPIGFVVSHVVLALVYYLVFTPIGLAMRLVGYDPMHRRFDPEAKTYWCPRKQDEPVDRYFRQS